ncbi:MAG: hypothetical protein GY854_09565 [Deltaproteobacteria bacterium]|nr:hypothetical protein [Deltaproteobacteria bacterium]
MRKLRGVAIREFGKLAIRVLWIIIVVFVFMGGPAEAIFADYAADMNSPISPRARAHYQYFKNHFEQPFDGYGVTDVFTNQFAVVLLSHAAVGFLNTGLAIPAYRNEVGKLLTEVTKRATSTKVSPYKKNLEHVRRFGDHNLYLSHVNLILGARRRITEDTKFDKLHRRITRHLAKRSTARANAHASSYPGSARFPADQTVTLASLYLYDLCHQTDLSKQPVRRWLDYMKLKATHKKTGLYRSSLSRSFKNSKLPRGCALSWSTLYMAQFAPNEAMEQYTRYRDLFFIDILGWGGFREYPPGVNGSMDVDSGPIFFGMGMAATGLGLGATRLFGDRRGYVSILRTASSFGLPDTVFSRRNHRLSPLLGEAILFHGITAGRWDEPSNKGQKEAASAFTEKSPFPFGAMLLFMAFCGILFVNVKTTIKRARSWMLVVDSLRCCADSLSESSLK